MDATDKKAAAEKAREEQAAAEKVAAEKAEKAREERNRAERVWIMENAAALRGLKERASGSFGWRFTTEHEAWFDGRIRDYLRDEEYGFSIQRGAFRAMLKAECTRWSMPKFSAAAA